MTAFVTMMGQAPSATPWKNQSPTPVENSQHASDTSPADFVVQVFRICGQNAQVVSPPATYPNRSRSGMSPPRPVTHRHDSLLYRALVTSSYTMLD